MQNSWLFFSNLGLHGGYPFISAAESYPTFSYSSERWLGLSLFLNNIPNHSGQIYVPGNLSPGVALAPLPHMTGGFLFWLMKRRNTDPATTFTKSEWWQELNYRKWYCFHKNCTAFDIAKGNVQNTQAIPICKSGTRSVILERVTPIMSRKQWTGCQHYPSFPVFMLAAAFVRLLNNLSSKLLAIPIDDTTEKIMMERHESVQSYCIVKRIGECNILHLTKKTNRSFRDVVEPSTGIRFPTDLLSSQCGGGNSSPTSQVLVGVGSRSTMIAKVKPVKVYAFGLYVHLDCVCNKLHQTYSNVPPEELRNRQDFFEDLLKQDLWMTVRLVVHLKGLKIGMVRNVFKRALRKRLIKIKGAADDDGLNAFCDYFSKDISISPGTTIDFHQTPGGHLRTDIDGKELGTIYSRDLCRAFFDMYVGECPVSLKTKQDIGENIGCVLRKC